MKTSKHEYAPGSPEAAERERWPKGPWDDEPDHAEFVHVGFPCLIHRNNMGAWCGYVGVPPGHPWHGKPYEDVDASAVGGLSYSEACQGSICHVPAPGEPDDVWWLGFDCAHSMQLVPGYGELLGRLAGFENARYWTMDDVLAETRSLAEQAQHAQAAP